MKKFDVKKLVTMALLTAIIVVFQLTAGMLPKLPGGANISLVLIPIVLGSAIYGPGAGAFLGAIFGAIAFYFSAIGADGVGFAMFQDNPILCFAVCILKSTLAGFASGWIYKLLKKTNGYLAMLFASIACPIINTGIFIASVSLFFNTTVIENDGVKTTIVSLFGAILLLNAIPELIINILFSPAGQRILLAVHKNR